MAARGLNVWVNIGAKVGSSIGSATRATERRFEQMGKRLRVIGAEMKASFKGIEEAQSARRARLFEGAAFAYGIGRAMQPFVGFEDGLARLGNTAEVQGAKLDAIGKNIIKTGARFGYGGRAAIVGANDFVAAGMNLDQAMGALSPTLKLAKTAGVEIGEASQAGISVMQNLGVEARDLGAAFDAMAKAGKLGKFEIADMAKAMPGVASRASVLGMSGLDGVQRMAAMLQIVRSNARDADEAGNNLLNFLDKLTSGDTEKKFAKMGVDIEAVFKRSKRRGTDFVDDMLDQLDRLTKGGKDGVDGFALSALFEDRQARMAALALIEKRKDYERIRKASGNGAGTLDADFRNIAKTSKFGLDRAAAGLERIGIAFGRAFGPALGDAAEKFAVFAERFANWADKNPGFVKMIGYAATGIIGLRTATAGLGMIFGGVVAKMGRFIGGGLLRMLPGAFGGVVNRIGVGLLNGIVRLGPLALRGLLALGPWLLRGVGLAFGVLSGPVGWALLAASAAGLVYTYRDKIAEKWGELTRWFTATAWPAVLNTVSAIGDIGARIVDAMIAGLSAQWGRLTSWFNEKMSSLGSSVGGWFSGGEAPKPAGARALGGSVSGGSSYLVGERGPEMFVPGRSGTIVPANKTAAALAGRGQGGGGNVFNVTVNATGGQNAHEIAREVERALRKLAGKQAVLLSD